MFNEALTALIESIKDMVSQMLKKADFDKAYTGRVKDVKQVREGLGVYQYNITVNGAEYFVKSKLRYHVDDYVLVLVPRNKWDEAKLLCTGEEVGENSETIKWLIEKVKEIDKKPYLEYRVISTWEPSSPQGENDKGGDGE